MLSFAPHFSLEELTFSEYAIRNGIDNTPSPDIITNLSRLSWWLEELRQDIGKPIIVSSAYRCPAVNKGIGGSKTSAHMQGLAADIKCASMTPLDLAKQTAQMMFTTGYDQVIHEFGRWVHVGLSDVVVQRFELLTAKLQHGMTVYEIGLKDV